MKNRYEIDWNRYAALARQAAAEGAVLLRNEDGALPLREGEKTAVFGRIQFDYYKSGTGSGGLVNTKYVVGILDALKEEKLILNGGVENYYREWMKDHPFDEGPGWAQEPWSQEEAPLPENIVRAAAEESEAAVIVIGRTAGEERDASAEKGSYLLTDLEEEMLHPVCKALRQVKNRPCGEEELEDEILQEYHIIRERQKLRLKGNVSVTIGDSQVELGTFSEGVEFFSDDRKRIRKIHIRDGRLMTVENYTSWLRLRPADTTLFYLGGYASREQRDFLKKTAEDNPGLRFVHFGDIDAGGLYIHEHLCRVTGIPFEMYRMSTKELQDPRYRSCLHPLTAQDRIRLESLKQQELYCQLASFMLTQNVKLEQEIVSYYEKQQEVT